MRSGALSETKPVSGGFLINWFYASDSERFWPKILGEKVSVGDYIYFLVGSTKWCRITLSVQNSIPNINAHGRQKASTVRLLVLVTSLHSVCGLDTIRHNRTNSLSFSAAAPLLSMALHGCLWEHLAQPSFYFIFVFFIFYTCSYAWEHTVPQKFKGQIHRIIEAFLQVCAVPLQGGSAGPPFTLRRKTLRLSTTGSDARFLLEPINTNLYAS